MAKKILVTELGREKQCGHCREFWPADEEFFYNEGKRGLSNWCKACYQENKNEKRRKEGTQNQTTERMELITDACT